MTVVPIRYPAKIAALLAVIMLGTSGCSTNIMRSYVGGSTEAVMARYGPPSDIRDLPDGRRAFQWMIVDTSVYPGTATTTVKDKSERRKSSIHTDFTPAHVEENRCFYTFYAHDVSGAWIIDSFAPPELGC
jgi:hypothetical protein